MYMYAYLIGALLLSNAVKISACAMDPNKFWHAATYLSSPWPSLMQQLRSTCVDEVPSNERHVKKLDNVARKDKQQSSNLSTRKESRD